MDTASWGNVTAWAEKARKVVAEQAQTTFETVQQGVKEDLELGEGAKQWTNWAKGAAGRARQSLEQAAEKAKAADWGEQAKATFGNFSENAAKAGAGFTEHAKIAQQKAAGFAGSAKEKLEKAGSSLGGMGALAMSPAKLLQFAGIFMLGMFLISLSFSFLPLLPIQPQKFALLFALGSMTVLGSVAWLRGPMPFLSAMIQRDKLPFTISYAVGLAGTLWATLIARSYIYTAIFSIMQAMGLLYFLASYVPGGKTVLNFFGRLCNRCMRAVIWRG